MINGRKILVYRLNSARMTTESFDDSPPERHEVIVRNICSHISAGTELACIGGLESFFTIPGTPGYTAVGEVLRAGEGVGHVRPGDMVYTYGPHAEYFRIDLTDRWHGVCVKVPEGLAPEMAALTHMAGIAMTALRSSDIELGDTVLVTGLGAIGNLAAQLVLLQGGKVIASDVVEQRLELARACGIERVFHPEKEDLGKQVDELTGGRGVSCLIDASGQSRVIAQSLDLVSLYGEVILLGSPRAPFETELTAFLKHFHNMPWCHRMKGALEFTWPTHETEFVKHSIERNARIIMELMLEGRLVTGPLLSHKILPGEIQSAYDGLREHPEEYTGVVIDWTAG